ncbi:MAG: CZB domain-containing protein [Sulfurimonas sp.]
MTKQEMLEAIESAKDIHKKQMDKIKDIMRGHEVDKPTALGKMECECGQWFYANQDIMIKILGHQLYERLDSIHERWHQDYSRVYEIYQKQQEKKKGFFSKVLGNGMDPLEYDKLKLYYKELSQITEEMFREADTAVRRVAALPESKFK